MRGLDDGDTPFRMPDGWYDPPEGSLPCPKCKAADAVIAIRDVIADTLNEFGVIAIAIDSVMAHANGVSFLEMCGDEAAAACRRDGGKECVEHSRAED